MALRLSRAGIASKTGWEAAGVALPLYDPAAVALHTIRNPRWLHFGAGNLFRAYIARLQQRLLNEGRVDTGIVVAASYDYESVEKIYEPHDNLALAVDLRPDGDIGVEVVGSIAETLRADPDWPGFAKSPDFRACRSSASALPRRLMR